MADNQTGQARQTGEARQTEEIRVGLTGPAMSGKTNLFVDLAECIQRGFHGFEQWRELEIETVRKHRELRQQFRRSTPPSTASSIDISFTLRFKDERGGIVEREVHVRDTPGEAVFPRSAGNAAMDEERKKLDEWFSQATGIVLVVSALHAGSEDGMARIENKIGEFFDRAGQQQYEKLERLVIAISMFDLLMLRFGSHALDIATTPRAVLEILHGHLRPAFDIIHDFQPVRGGKRRIALRFLATSSYGFHPAFGCPNVELEAATLDPSKLPYPDPIKPDNKRYPYMTADAFVFAATGIGSPFLFTREQILAGAL